MYSNINLGSNDQNKYFISLLLALETFVMFIIFFIIRINNTNIIIIPKIDSLDCSNSTALDDSTPESRNWLGGRGKLMLYVSTIGYFRNEKSNLINSKPSKY